MKIGEKIRDSIQNKQFYGQENQPNKNVTMSVGVSSYPTKSKSKHQLINTADDALYRAKFFNRNRVEVYYSVLEEIAKDTNVEHDTITSIKAFIGMINKKDKYMYGHTERVVIYSNSFSNYVNLNEHDKKTLRFGAYLHDIGKIDAPEEVLNKRERLTDKEFDILKQHPTMGVEVIQHIDSFKELIPLILHHHERYDGRGYPTGLKGDEIPYLARILTIADSFDAMTSNRPYNNRKNYDEAIEELRRCSGTQFDPELVESFIEMIELNKENFSGYAIS
jgi:putative nucleotidyltransferase with HDIG domain